MGSRGDIPNERSVIDGAARPPPARSRTELGGRIGEQLPGELCLVDGDLVLGPNEPVA
jgi:hypothetical protein